MRKDRSTPIETLIARTRQRLQAIVQGDDDRLAVIIGPCSIHDPEAAIDYARRLAAQRQAFADEIEIVMRVYFEKPRTSLGWKGLINDPHLDGSFRIIEGLRIARDVLVRINGLGVPAGCEFLDTISPQYIGDLVAWGAIGARTTESQVHRELASGLSAPIGFKNGTDGNVKIAIERNDGVIDHFADATTPIAPYPPKEKLRTVVVVKPRHTPLCRHAPERWPGISRNRGPASSGTVARHGPELVAGMGRNPQYINSLSPKSRYQCYQCRDAD